MSHCWTFPKEAAGWCSPLLTAVYSGMLGAYLLSRELFDHFFSQSVFVFCSQHCCQWIASITTFSRQQSGEDHENVFVFTGRETVFPGLSSELGLCLLHQWVNTPFPYLQGKTSCPSLLSTASDSSSFPPDLFGVARSSVLTVTCENALLVWNSQAWCDAGTKVRNPACMLSTESTRGSDWMLVSVCSPVGCTGLQPREVLCVYVI